MRPEVNMVGNLASDVTAIFSDEEKREFYLTEAIKHIKEKCHEKD